MNNQEPNTAGQKAWPLGGAQRRQPSKKLPFQGPLKWLGLWIRRMLSNLRMSLTLRIALHYAGHLLKTTLPMMAVLIIVFWMAQYPYANSALERLSMRTPGNGNVYTMEQLQDLPFDRALQSDVYLPDGLEGQKERFKVAFEGFASGGARTINLMASNEKGSIIAAWNVEELIRTSAVLMGTFLCIDLYRVVIFLRKRNRLNRKVLKPITDMAEMAATLSASNLSDRLSVEGAKNELKDLALVINGMLDRIEVSYNSQKQFVSDASHELRTPIAVIQGYVGMLERWGKTDKDVLDEGLTAIAQEASSMKELVERLLFLARHDKKTLMLETEVFNPLEVMSEIHREAKMLSDQHVFRLEPAQNTLICADKDMIKQLMRILLDNAIKYTPQGGSITLGVRREKGHCVLSVTDTGAGISAEDLPKVFDRFYRCEEARKAQTSGHGLGLSIARIIVAAHSGKLTVRSKVGAGTTFSVHLLLETEE